MTRCRCDGNYVHLLSMENSLKTIPNQLDMNYIKICLTSFQILFCSILFAQSLVTIATEDNEKFFVYSKGIIARDNSPMEMGSKSKRTFNLAPGTHVLDISFPLSQKDDFKGSFVAYEGFETTYLIRRSSIDNKYSADYVDKKPLSSQSAPSVEWSDEKKSILVESFTPVFINYGIDEKTAHYLSQCSVEKLSKKYSYAEYGKMNSMDVSQEMIGFFSICADELNKQQKSIVTNEQSKGAVNNTQSELEGANQMKSQYGYKIKEAFTAALWQYVLVSESVGEKAVEQVFLDVESNMIHRKLTDADLDVLKEIANEAGTEVTAAVNKTKSSGGTTKSYNSQSTTQGRACYSCKGSGECSECTRTFKFKIWKKYGGWDYAEETKPGWVKCEGCNSYGEHLEFDSNNNSPRSKSCYNGSCVNGWVKCPKCYGIEDLGRCHSCHGTGKDD
jgi:hypothetical protein